MKKRFWYMVLLAALGGVISSCNMVTEPSGPPWSPAAYEATQVGRESFRANWGWVDGATEYHLYVSPDPAFSYYLGEFCGKQVYGTEALVIGLEPGTLYYYRVRAGNAYGTSYYSNTVTVRTQDAPFFLSFRNTVFTPIDISVSGYGSRTLEPDQTTTWELSRSDGTYTYGATTYGTTDSGNPIGLQLIWEDTNYMEGSSYTINLVTSSDYFYVYLQNNGTHSLSPLYVNYGSSHQTQDDVMFPANGVKYNVGYYRALGNGTVRAYWTYYPSEYSYWSYGPYIPWTQNQSLTLINYSKGSASGVEGQVSGKSIPSGADENKAEKGSREIPARIANPAAMGNPVAAK